MPSIFSRDSLRKHWSGFLWLLPGLLLGRLYEARLSGERIRLADTPCGWDYQYPLTALTATLGHALPWVFWGGLIAFVLHALAQRRNGRAWLWAKLLFVPVYLVLKVVLFLHVE